MSTERPILNLTLVPTFAPTKNPTHRPTQVFIIEINRFMSALPMSLGLGTVQEFINSLESETKIILEEHYSQSSCQYSGVVKPNSVT